MPRATASLTKSAIVRVILPADPTTGSQARAIKLQARDRAELGRGSRPLLVLQPRQPVAPEARPPAVNRAGMDAQPQGDGRGACPILTGQDDPRSPRVAGKWSPPELDAQARRAAPRPASPGRQAGRDGARDDCIMGQALGPSFLLNLRPIHVLRFSRRDQRVGPLGVGCHPRRQERAGRRAISGEAKQSRGPSRTKKATARAPPDRKSRIRGLTLPQQPGCPL